ncbi:MAG: PrsW family intramembrane metalloprotease [Woeseia sp.]
MDYLACFAPLVLPVLFWAGYHYYKDRHLPEPMTKLLLSFFLGVIAAYLGKLMYSGLDLVGLRFDAFQLAGASMAAVFAYAVLVIGVVEELAKLIPFLLVVLRFRAFGEPIDGIIYASFIALGFATVENVQYFAFLDTAEALARGFAGPLVHIMFASVWGYHIGMAFLRGTRLIPTTLAAIAVTALLHGIYDFVVIALPAPLLPVAALLILAIWLWRMRLIRGLNAAYSDKTL